MNKKELIKKYEYLNHDCFRRVDTSEVLKDLKQLYEPGKVKIPQFVADWIEKSRLKGWDLLSSMCFTLNDEDKKTIKWLHLGENVNIFARAWLDGYEVEKEKRYQVEMKGISSLFRHLKYNFLTEKWYMGNDTENEDVKKTHTRKEIEDAGFGWVFDCEGIEIEEVTE